MDFLLNFLSDLKTLAHLWYCGVYDAVLSPRRIIRTLKGSPTIRSNIFHCFFYNGVIFLGSLILFKFVLQPIVRWALDWNIDDQTEFYGFDATMIFSGMYYIFYLYPVYILSFGFNMVWLDQIAGRSYRLVFGDKQVQFQRNMSLVNFISQEIYHIMLYGSYLIICFLVLLIPVIGPSINFICLSWLYSLYSFEYKWDQGNALRELSPRLAFFEAHWTYFIGFGTPFTMLCVFFPYLISYGVYAIVFPFFIIMAINARPQRMQFHYFPANIRMFYLPRKLNDCFIHALMRYIVGRESSRTQGKPALNTPVPTDVFNNSSCDLKM